MEHDLDAAQLQRMLDALGCFALRMLVTYLKYSDEMDEAASAEFQSAVEDWVAVAGEFLPVEDIVEEMQRGTA